MYIMNVTPFGSSHFNQLQKNKFTNTEKAMNDLRAASVYGNLNLQYKKKIELNLVINII